MLSRLRHGILIGIAMFALFFTVEYGYGTVVEYIYDENGNLVEKRIQADTSAPTTTASPPGGIYNTVLSVTLTCDDGTGWGCDKIYYMTDGVNGGAGGTGNYAGGNGATGLTGEFQVQ